MTTHHHHPSLDVASALPSRSRRRGRRAAVGGLVVVSAALASCGSDAADAAPDLAGVVFSVETTISESNNPDLPVGTVFPNCYSFGDDGEFVDSGFPDPTQPAAAVAGTFDATEGDATTNYEAEVVAGPLVLLQEGVVSVGDDGSLSMSASTDIMLEGALMLSAVAVGQAVEECELG